MRRKEGISEAGGAMTVEQLKARYEDALERLNQAERDAHTFGRLLDQSRKEAVDRFLMDSLAEAGRLKRGRRKVVDKTAAAVSLLRQYAAGQPAAPPDSLMGKTQGLLARIDSDAGRADKNK